MNRPILSAVLAYSALVVGCERPPEAPANPPPVTASVWLEPGDKWTAIGAESPIQASINNRQQPVGADGLATLAAVLRVSTYPELVDIEVEVTSADADDIDGQAHIRLIPVLPLEDRWYTLRVLSVPAEFSLAPLMRRVAFDDGSIGIRFRPDSYPTLTAIRFCDQGGETWSVVLDFSEPIDESADLASLVTIASGSSSCQGYFWGRSLNFICSDFSPDVSVEISVSPGLVGASGVPVSDMSGSTSFLFTETPNLLPTVGECKALHVED